MVIFVAGATGSPLHVSVISHEGYSVGTELRAALKHIKVSSKSPENPCGYWKNI